MNQEKRNASRGSVRVIDNYEAQQQEIRKLRSSLHSCHVQFIKTELDVGNTFAWVAANARRNSQEMARCEQVARSACRTASRFAAALNLSSTERQEFEKKMQTVNDRLAKLPREE